VNDTDRPASWILDLRHRLATPPPARLPPAEASRRAAVLVPLYVDAGALWVVLTRRAAGLPYHRDQIAFPGGAIEPGEESWAAALREAHEEIGLDLGTVKVLGRLPERVSIASYLVHVFVARIPPPMNLRCDPSEVDALLEIAVPDLQDSARWQWRDLVARAGVHRRVPFYECAGGPLWGLTAILTLDLLGRFRSADPA
jgi:8-oxo-dGTP pyrophosphatase MutT (NUDIX family)